MGNRRRLHATSIFIILFFLILRIIAEGKLSNVLKKTRLRTVNLQTCQAGYLKNGNQITENQYCAIDRDPMGAVCPCPGMDLF